MIYLQTKFHRHISIYSWDRTTSGLEKQTSVILEFFRLRLWPHHSNRSAILHQTTKFHPNRATGGGIMTSYNIFKIEAAAAPYYFRFRVWWCHSPKGQNLPTNQISLNPRLRYNYFRFGKKNVRHIGIFLPFAILPGPINLRAILNEVPRFRPNRATRGDGMTSYWFSR